MADEEKKVEETKPEEQKTVSAESFMKDNNLAAFISITKDGKIALMAEEGVNKAEIFNVVKRFEMIQITQSVVAKAMMEHGITSHPALPVESKPEEKKPDVPST